MYASPDTEKNNSLPHLLHPMGGRRTWGRRRPGDRSRDERDADDSDIAQQIRGDIDRRAANIEEEQNQLEEGHEREHSGRADTEQPGARELNSQDTRDNSRDQYA